MTHSPSSPAGIDRLSLLWSDSDGAVRGLLRVTAGPGPGTEADLFLASAGEEAVTTSADGGSGHTAGGLSLEPQGEEWVAHGGGVELRFRPTADPVQLALGDRLTSDRLGTVEGTVATPGAHRQPLAAPARLVHTTGPDVRLAVWRELFVRPSASTAVIVQGARESQGDRPDREQLAAMVVNDGSVVPIAEPRFSTAYDGSGRPTRIGLELWPEEEPAPVRRVAGERVAGATLTRGEQRIDVAFLRARMEGHEGPGVLVLERR